MPGLLVSLVVAGGSVPMQSSAGRRGGGIAGREKGTTAIPKHWEFRESDDFKEDVRLKDLEARKCLSVLEERMQQGDHEMSVLRTERSRHLRVQESASESLLGGVARCGAEVSVLGIAPALRLVNRPSG
jgi:hypothetical protein